MSSTALNLLYALLLSLGAYLVTVSLTRRTGIPGPTRLPLIGSAHKIPTEKAWLTFSQWKNVYGNLIHLDLLGQPMIVVNSARIAKEMLAKRSSIYSDRPVLMMAKLCGYYQSFTLLPYGDEWRSQRRIVASELSVSKMPDYSQLQDASAAKLVQNIMADPSCLMTEVKLRIGAIVLRIAYGYDVESADDPILALAVAGVDNFSTATTPGAFFVDLIPALQYLPEWLPGTGFLKKRDEWKKILTDAVINPYEWTKGNMHSDDLLRPNLCASHIEEAGDTMSESDENSLKWAAGTILGGALDTTTSLVLTFFRAMILNPRIVAKAQAEIDRVIGPDRLPSITDKENLPYVRSIVAEVLRFGPPIPLGIPHSLKEDDMYEGYFLPKGSIIFPNIWHMLNDPEEYDDPSDFNPERYRGLDSEMAKVYEVVFGFGRRVCPGLNIADGTLFAIIATTLSTCNILPGIDGKIPSKDYQGGTISFPEQFSLRLKQRSVQSGNILAEGNSDTNWGK